MTSFENYLNSFKADMPEKKEFKGRKQEAVNQNGELTDINNDKKANIADALNDGIFTAREYQGLTEAYQAGPADKADFDKALNIFLQGDVPSTGVNFSDQINEISMDQGTNKEMVFSETNKSHGYAKADLVTGNIGVKITDRDGINTDSKEDIDINLTGETTINTIIPDDVDIPPGVNVSVNNNAISLNFAFFELLNIKLEKSGKDSNIVITPPDPKLIEVAKKLGAKVPDIDEKMVGQLFGLKEGAVKKEDGKYRASLLDYIKNKFPDGIPVGSKKLNLNTLDTSKVIIKEAEIIDDKLRVRLDFNNTAINAGTGKDETKPKLNETMEINLSVGEIKLGQEVSPASALSYGTVKISNISEAIKKALSDLGEGHLKDVKVDWKNQAMIISASLSDGPVKAAIPFKISETSVSMDLSGVKALGIPVIKAAERINQYLSNTTEINSAVRKNTISFDINELILKSGVNLAKDYKVQYASIGDNSISFMLSKKEQKASDFPAPAKQPPVFPKNIVSPVIGVDTGGNGIFGAGYTRATPLGQSLIGSLFHLDKNLGTVPNLSYSYLDHTVNFAASGSTDGAFRGEVSTGIRGSANPVGIPVYLEADPLGLGIKASKDGVSPYLPLKIGGGYDDGKYTAGLFYQHNFVIGGKDDNIFGATAGIRWK
jgi:hypothetical protein